MKKPSIVLLAIVALNLAPLTGLHAIGLPGWLLPNNDEVEPDTPAPAPIKPSSPAPAPRTAEAGPVKTRPPIPAGENPEAKENPEAMRQFRKAYEALKAADKARDARRSSEAVRLYEDALGAYKKLASEYPDWQPGIIKFRIAYCTIRVNELIKQVRVTKDIKPLRPPAGSRPNPRPTPRAEPPLKGIRKQRVEQAIREAKEFLEQGKAKDAREILIKGLKLDPDNEDIRLLVGMAQCQDRKFEDAVFVLRPLIAEHPGNALAHVALGTAYFGIGRTGDAQQSMTTALKIDPRLREAHYNLAQILLSVFPPNIRAARDHYQKALGLGAKPDKTLEKRLGKD